MKFRFINILFVYLLLMSNTLLSQWLKPPYHLEPSDKAFQNIIAEGKFFSQKQLTLVNIINSNDNYSSIVFERPNLSLEDNNYNFSLTNSRVSRFTFVQDIDNDGYDELIFAYSENYNLHLILVDPSNKIRGLEIGKFKISSNFYFGNIFYHIEKPLKKRGEILITFSEISPFKEDAFLRGQFLYSFKKKKILWKHFTADYLTTSFPVKEVNNKLYLYYFTSAVDNFCFKSKGKLYNFDGESVLKSSLDENAPDYSTDTLSYFVILDLSNGKEVKREKFGPVSTWVQYFKRKGKDFLNYYHRQSKNDTWKHFGTVEFNPDGYKFKELIKADKYLFPLSDMALFGLNGKNFIFSYDNFSITPFVNEYSRLFEVNKGQDKYYMANKNGTFLLLDQDFNVIAKLPGPLNWWHPYLNSVDLFQITKDDRVLQYKLVKTPFWDRVTQKFYFFIVVAFSIIIIVILFLWIYTMKISRKKLLIQTKELEETTAKLIQSERLAVLGTISAGIAHELNSPLGAILNSAERIYDSKIEMRDDPNLKLILKASRRMKSLTEKFLLSARNETSGGDSCSLQQVVDDWITLYGNQFYMYKINIKTDINCSRNLNIGYVEMSQVLNNLLTNARDSIEENDKDREIIIYAFEEDDNCILIVKDTGTGFSEEMLKNSMNAFITSKEKGKGTGLGLWIINQLISKYDGKINIANYENGAIVKLIIPVK